MKQALARLFAGAPAPAGLFETVLLDVVRLTIAAVIVAMLINFATSFRHGRVAHERRSPVATATMLLFFAGCYNLIHLHVGVLALASQPLRIAVVLTGAALMVVGCAINILGRVSLGANWANHATVYADQTLVTRGPFRVVRHPLYASLIWLCYGACLAYLNYAAFLANTLIFVPAMYYRAGLEEQMLMERFPEYTTYRRRIGMLFPKWGWRTRNDGHL